MKYAEEAALHLIQTEKNMKEISKQSHRTIMVGRNLWRSPASNKQGGVQLSFEYL